MRPLVVLSLVSGIAFFSCSAGYSRSYAVHIDKSFSPEERGEIMGSLNEWSARTGAHLGPVDIIDRPHAWAPHPFNEDLFLVVAANDRSCPDNQPLKSFVAMHYHFDATHIECFDMVWFRAHSALLPRTVLHETGHALGLRFPGKDPTHEMDPKVPSVMHPVVGDDAEHVTCTDVASFCNEYGTCDLTREDCI